MIEEQAKVVEVQPNQHIVVESIVKSTCSGCNQLENCGSGQISKAFPQKKLTYTIPCTQTVRVGDNVVIGLSEQIVLSAAWQVYMWPLIGLIITSAIGQWLLAHQWFNHELYSVLLGVTGGYLGFYLARKKQQKMANCEKWTPSLVKVLGSSLPFTQISP